MLRTNLPWFLVAVLFFVAATISVGQESTAALDKKIKTQVRDMGTGAKVTVFLKDGTKIRGSISQILDDSFDLTIKDETQSSIISYRDVAKIKKRGWSSSAKIGLGVAIGVGAVVGIIAIIATQIPH